jgi:pimeloyl-ACP methyl ester carboxylesterase
VILDYIRQCGEDRIGGIQLVAGITNLGTPDAIEALTPEFLALVPGFISDDATASVASLEDLLQLCFPTELQTEDRYLMLGYSAHVPPSVRRALLSRTLDNDDVLAGIRKPVLITHATDDVVVKPEAVERHKLRLPHAAIDLMDHAGHACFFNDAPRFNRRLRQFAMSL